MTLHLIGIGYKKENITIEQFEIIKKSKIVFLEYYTSFYQDSFEELEKFLNKKIEICSREIIENQIEEKIIKPAKGEDISLLVLGDPLIATTHIDLIQRTKKEKIDIKIYNNISIANLITKTGLSFYKFGKITSIPFTTPSFMPKTPYLYFKENKGINSHTLFLLDLDPINNKFLKITKALDFLINISKNEEIKINTQTKVIVCSKLGMDDERIVYGDIEKIKKLDKEEEFQKPLCLIIPSNLHEMEKEFLQEKTI